MKKLALLFIVPVLAFAADPVVVVKSYNSVTIDGVAVGTVVDALANSTAPNIRARLLDAWIDHEKSVTTAEKNRADAAIDKAQKSAAAEIKAAKDAAAVEIDKLREDLTKARQDAAKADAARAAEGVRVQAIVAALEGVNPATLPAAVKTAVLSEKEKQRAAFLEAKAKIDAELAKLNSAK